MNLEGNLPSDQRTERRTIGPIKLKANNPRKTNIQIRICFWFLSSRMFLSIQAWSLQTRGSDDNLIGVKQALKHLTL